MEDSAVVRAAADSAEVARAVAVPSAAAHMAVLTEEATAEAMAVEAAEWAVADKSEHKFPDFSIRHLLNLAH